MRGGGYARAVARFGEGQTALLAAISAYNTGDRQRGFANGYVARVTGIPAMADLTVPAQPSPYTATTVAYSREAIHVRIE